MIKYLPLTSFVASLAAFAYAAQLPIGAIGVAIITLTAMALPGIALLRRALPGESSALVILVFGSAFGLALGRIGLTATSLLFGQGPIAPILLLMSLAVPSIVDFARRGLPVWDKEDSKDGRWLLGLLSVLFLVIAVVFWGVGRPTSAGFAFTPYFDRDFMNHIAVTAELARGLPPENPYFAGERLHYYWGFHLWPSAVKVLAGVTAREALTVTLPPTVGLFVASLILWSRLYMNGSAVRYAAVATSLFAFSYIGVLFLLKLTLPGLVQHLPMISSREYSFLSHSWFRDFLYEPHAVTGLTLLLAILFLNHSPFARRRAIGGFLVGIGFGTILVTDAFIGLVGLLFFAVMNFSLFVREPITRRPVMIAAAVTVTIVAAAVALGVFPVEGRAVQIVFHPMAKIAPAYLLIELGPQFGLGVIGAALVVYRRESLPLRPLLGLFLLALLIGFTLKVLVEPNIVIRKSLKVAQIPLIVFVGVTYSSIIRTRRRLVWCLAGIVVIPGFVTLGTDIAQYLDLIEKRTSQTTYVSPDEMEMLKWVRTNTHPNAILLMSYPDRIFGVGTPVLIESLAERRTYYGNGEFPNTFQVPRQLVASRHAQVEALFAAAGEAELVRILKGFPQVYLYVDERGGGPLESIREAEAHGVLRIVHRSGHFALFALQDSRPSEPERP